jgi:hypothetical protein
MATYTTQTISNYNTNPPPDDGTSSSDNEVTWAKHKTKLADPVKTLAEAINTQLVTSFNTVDTALAKRLMQTTGDKTSTFTLGAADDGKILRCTGTFTIDMDAAATLGDGWKVVIFNEGSGTLTIDPDGAETINGAATITVTGQYDYAIISCDGTNLVAMTSTSALSAYPVGAVYISVVSTSPATLFGGTWSAFGAGKMLVGYDSGDTDFDASEETGGAKTATLTETELPAHTHTVSSFEATHDTTGLDPTPDTVYTNTGSGTTTSSTGSGSAFSIMNPYITVYMWKRTA